MKDELFIGRKNEMRQLQNCVESKQSQLVIVYGRRRVGKSFLINQFFDENFDFKLVGDLKLDKEGQLLNFYNELKRKSQKEIEIPKDWRDAFWQLRDYLDAFKDEKKHVVFFDEMPWLDNQKSDFLPAFEYFWNSFGASKNNLMFIVCGSATSWLVENIDHNKGGLFNRQNLRLYLEPFTLQETEEFLIKKKNINWSRYDICECYMILGGIPYYLDLLDRNFTCSQNIDNLFFKKHAVLWDEFNHLYHTLFRKAENYIKVVEAVSTKRIGLSRKEIIEKTKLRDNSDVTKILQNLTDSGFLRAYSFFGKKKQGTLFQIADYFTMFYLKFVKGSYGKDEDFWAHNLESPARRAWCGFTFEQVCKDHIKQIKHKLSIAGVYSEQSAWFTNADDIHDGAQIDLLIDRRDRIIDVCEIKFSEKPFVINKDYDLELRDKIGIFKSVTKTTKAVQLVMITTFGVQQNMYSSLVQGQVIIDDLFKDY
ncbi:MAG: ATP-binding protein [Treponema sp.]|nr:ATP-binding protein [Treponema sp.]